MDIYPRKRGDAIMAEMVKIMLRRNSTVLPAILGTRDPAIIKNLLVWSMQLDGEGTFKCQLTSGEKLIATCQGLNGNVATVKVFARLNGEDYDYSVIPGTEELAIADIAKAAPFSVQ